MLCPITTIVIIYFIIVYYMIIIHINLIYIICQATSIKRWVAPSSFAPNSESLPPPHNPPCRRRTANMNPVLCVPQRARPLFEGLRGLCVGVPPTSLPPQLGLYHLPPGACPRAIQSFTSPESAYLFTPTQKEGGKVNITEDTASLLIVSALLNCKCTCES